MSERAPGPRSTAETVTGLRLFRRDATPGRWIAEENLHSRPHHWTIVADCNEDDGAHDGFCWVADLGTESRDTLYIVAMHNALPALLDALAGALAEIERLRAALCQAKGCMEIAYMLADGGDVPLSGEALAAGVRGIVAGLVRQEGKA